MQAIISMLECDCSDNGTNVSLPTVTHEQPQPLAAHVFLVHSNLAFAEEQLTTSKLELGLIVYMWISIPSLFLYTLLACSPKLFLVVHVKASEAH